MVPSFFSDIMRRGYQKKEKQATGFKQTEILHYATYYKQFPSLITEFCGDQNIVWVLKLIDKYTEFKEKTWIQGIPEAQNLKNSDLLKEIPLCVCPAAVVSNKLLQLAIFTGRTQDCQALA